MPQYSKTTWVNDNPPAIDAERLNKIENGIFDALPKDGSVAMTGQLVTTAGSATTPAIAPTGDANTGIFFPAADTIAFGEGGTEVMRINSSGQVGIGIDPTNKLHLYQNNTNQQYISISNATSTFLVGQDSSGNMVNYTNQAVNYQWSNSGTPRLTITSSGNVGIGTTSPTNKLQIDGVTANTSCINAIANTTTGQSFGIALSAGTNSTDYALNIRNAAQTAQLFHITGAGNVGIGTTSPNLSNFTGKILTIESASSPVTELSSTGSNSDGKHLGSFCWANNASGVTSKFAAQIAVHQSGTNATSPGSYMSFTTRTDGSTTSERMRITSTGSVGIGDFASNPPPVQFSVSSLTGGVVGVTTKRGSGTNASPIPMSYGFYGYLDSEKARITATERSGNTNASDLNFLVKDSSDVLQSRLYISTSGNVGINTSSPGDKLHVEGNFYLGTASRTIYTAGTGNLTLQTGTGNIIFARNNATDTTMFLNNSGNVGIGTNNPTFDLHVFSASSGADIMVETNTTGGDSKIALKCNGAGGRSWYWQTGDNASTLNGRLRLVDSTAGAERLTITSTGNVGIGTTNTDLGTYGATAKVVTLLSSTGFGVHELASGVTPADSNVLGVVSFVNNGSGITAPVATQIAGFQSGSHATYPGGKLIFYTRANGSTSLSERLTITDSGNVGIGTTAPSDKLEVVGGIRRKQVTAGTTASPASEIGLQYQFDNTANRSGIYFLNSYNSNGAAWMSFWTSNTSNVFAERMRIDAAGNVGVGTESPTVAANVTTHCLNNTSGSQYELFVNGTRTGIFTASSTTVSLRNLTANPLLFFTNSIERLHIEAGGNVRPSANNSQDLGSSLYRWSTIYAQNALNTSDARLKTDVESSSLGLDFISALNPVQFRYTEGGNTVERVQTGTETVEILPAIPAQPEVLDEEGNVIQEATEEVPAVTEEQPVYEEVVTPREGVRTHFGLIAQEVKAALPDGLDFGGWALADKEDADSTQFLGYMELIGPMIKAIQELKAEVDALKAQLNK